MTARESAPWLGKLSTVTSNTLTLLLLLCLPTGLENVARGANSPSSVLGNSPRLAKDTYHMDGRGTPKLIIPSPAAKPAIGQPGQQVAEQFLRDQHAELKLPADLANLELSRSQESLLGTHYRYRQKLNGVPVEGADLVVSVSRSDGQVYQAYNNTFPVMTAPAVPKTQLGTSNALDVAWNHLRVHGRLLSGPRAEAVYLPVSGGFRLVYKTFIAVEAPFGYWEHYIDAQTGEVVAVRDTAVCGKKQAGQQPDFASYKGRIWSRAKTTQTWEATASLSKQTSGLNKNTVDGTALVFDGDPRTYLANAGLINTSSASAFTAAYVTRVLRDISETGGVYSLEGPWVQIVNTEAPNTAPSTTVNGQWTALRGNNAFNDAMTYFHIDQNQRYLQSLGFNNIQHGPIQADSDGLSGDDNSHYIPGDNQLAFGHGGVDDNEDADVILHEYGHAITFSIVPSWGGGDTDAIGEGFGDYWGGSYSSTTTNGRTFHPEWAFSWDGHSGDTWPGRLMNLTNLTYDPNHTYTAHETINSIANYSDQLWSTPLFQSFLALLNAGYPRTDVDKIIIEAQYGVGGNTTMRDLANSTVNAAALLFPSGPHASVFTEKFLKQLILAPPALPSPTFVSPAGGETFATGAVVQVQWNRQGAPASAAARLEYSAGITTNFSDTMEGGTSGWTLSHTGGSLNWSQVTTASHTPTHSWFAANQAIVSDQFLRSPAIIVSSNAQLSFWHSYNLESGYDGGVVEISLNGTTWADIGTNATQNGYNNTVATGFSNPISGRRAFSGSSGGFIQTLIPLSNYAGQTVYIRFRESNDNEAAATGWYVDDVAVTSQWIPIATTSTNASNYAWKLPPTPTTNGILRIKQFASGYTDSAWTQSAPFKISTNASPPVTPINLTQATRLANGTFRFGFTNTPGAQFSVLKSTNLLVPLGSWQVVTGVTELSPGQFQFTDAAATNTPQNFYRVRSP